MGEQYCLLLQGTPCRRLHALHGQQAHLHRAQQPLGALLAELRRYNDLQLCAGVGGEQRALLRLGLRGRA